MGGTVPWLPQAGRRDVVHWGLGFGPPRGTECMVACRYIGRRSVASVETDGAAHSMESVKPAVQQREGDGSP